MMEEEVQDSSENITMEEDESTNVSKPTNDQIIEQNTSKSTSWMSVFKSDDTIAESQDSGSDPTDSSAESDVDSLDTLIASANNNGRHRSSPSQKFLALSILKAVRQKDKNSLLQILKTCKENGFPQSRKITNTCWRALRLAISSQSHKKCLKLLLEYNNGVLISLSEEIVRLIYRKYDLEKDINILLLLQKGYEFHERSKGESILHYAATYGKSRIISLLSTRRVDINIKDSNGCTPLHLSVQNCYLEATRILLENGADVLLADNVGDLPLHYAIHSCYSYSHYRDIISLLVERDSTTINYPNNRGETPFFCAVDQGREMSLISYLLEKGARTVDTDSEVTAFEHAALINRKHLLPLLLESVPVGLIKKYCLFDISRNFDALNTAIINPKCIVSLTCSAINIGPDCLADLISRNLPEAVLQAPSVLKVDLSCPFDTFHVISPLAYLFRRFFEPRNERFDPCLDMLLKHKITMLDKFRSAHLLEWPKIRASYTHPFTFIFHHSVPLSEQLRYFNLLNANDITIDYCLRCYHDNSKSFATFTDYERFYEPVVSAAHCGDIETVKLLISTSDILEPDLLSNCLHSMIPMPVKSFPSIYEEIRPMFEYLISLKLAYHKHDEFFLSSYFTLSERFSIVTLKGLCRTVIRKQLREATFEDNLLNFRRKIFELPLPNLLKDYLLFKF